MYVEYIVDQLGDTSNDRIVFILNFDCTGTTQN